MYPPVVLAESLRDLPKLPTKVGGQSDFHGAREAQSDALTCCACVLKTCAIEPLLRIIAAGRVHNVKQVPAVGTKKLQTTFLIMSSQSM